MEQKIEVKNLDLPSGQENHIIALLGGSFNPVKFSYQFTCFATALYEGIFFGGR
jgi:hypothetical protein